MADFKTHFIGGAFVSGAGALLLRTSDIADVEHAAGYFMVGVVGGLVPDVDLGTSVPVRLARRLVAIVATLLAVLVYADRLSVFELALIGVGSYGLIQLAFELFDRFTAHRGLVHSLPVAAAAGLSTGACASYGFDADPQASWFYASFMTVGFVTHLTLDELYSVNLLGARFKKSFGSALSLGDKDNWLGTLVWYILVFVLWMLQPTSDSFWMTMSDSNTYTALLQNLLP